jgi:hypothetical protein
VRLIDRSCGNRHWQSSAAPPAYIALLRLRSELWDSRERPATIVTTWCGEKLLANRDRFGSIILSKNEQKTHVRFLERLAQALQSSLAKSKPDAVSGDYQSLGIGMMVAELVHYSHAMYKMARSGKHDYACDALARAILEISVSIRNLIRDPDYAAYLFYLSLAHDKRVLTSANSPNRGDRYQPLADLAAAHLGLSLEQMKEQVAQQMEVLKNQIPAQYLNKNREPIDRAESRFAWANMTIDYETTFRHLSQRVHLVFPLRSVLQPKLAGADLNWPPAIEDDYPLMAVDVAVSVLSGAGLEAVTFLKGPIDGPAAIRKALFDFYDVVYSQIQT